MLGAFAFEDVGAIGAVNVTAFGAGELVDGLAVVGAWLASVPYDHLAVSVDESGFGG